MTNYTQKELKSKRTLQEQQKILCEQALLKIKRIGHSVNGKILDCLLEK